jgi:hypothetical protein
MMEGEHKLELKRGDETIFKKYLIIKTGETIVVDVSPIVPLTGLNSKESVDEMHKDIQSDTADTAEDKSVTSEINDSHLQDKLNPSSLRNIGIIVGSIGGATAIAGIITGAFALSKDSSLEEQCPDKKNCSSSDKHLAISAKSLGVATNVLLPLGGGLLITGAVLAIVGHKKKQKSNESFALHITPTWNNDGLYFYAGGSF